MLRCKYSVLLFVASFALLCFSQERVEKSESELPDERLPIITKPRDKQCKLVSKPKEEVRLPLYVERTGNGGIAGWTVRLKLNGHDTRVLVDTGASGLLVSKKAAARANLTAIAYSEFRGLSDKRPLQGNWALASSIKLGELEFRDCMIKIANAKDNRADGYIGPDIFSDYLVALDFPGKQVKLSSLPKRRKKPEIPLRISEGEPAPNRQNVQQNGDNAGAKQYSLPEMQSWIPVSRASHLLLISASINDSPPELFIIDTGAAQSSISLQAASGRVNVRQDHFSFLRTFNGTIEKFWWGGKVKLSFARFEQHRRNVLVIDTSKLSKDIGIEVSGFLGADTLGQMMLSIDYRDRLVDFQYDPKRLGSEWTK